MAFNKNRRIEPENLNTIEECKQAWEELSSQGDEIERQLLEAKGFARNGEYSDPDWFSKTNHAHRIVKRIKTQVQNRMAEIKKASRKAFAKDLAEYFIEVAKEKLSEDAFHEIMDKAKEKKQILTQSEDL